MAGVNLRPLYLTLGSVKSDICVRGHIFAVKENPRFHERHHTEEEKPIIVIADARKEWPSVFIGDATCAKNTHSDETHSITSKE
jgi:riboflavin biosynthesis pyrimidine reductase